MTDPPRTSEALSSAMAESGPASRVGTTIRGKWRVDALIGAGGMAAVYGATHRNGQRAALKVLHLKLAHETSVRDRFLREGYVANSVNHPGCVAVLDDDITDDGAPLLIMELLEGVTLSRRWKNVGKRMPIEEALGIADPVLDCLAACHAASVIHRDLKPPNIFLTDDGRVKILDFGVAQLRDATAEKTRTGTALGTPYYMSPEQAMGLVDQLDGRADLFSVGAILYALVTGQRIHSARTENEALILAATTPVPSVARVNPSLPVEVVRLIDKSLTWDRRARYGDAREMQRAVRETLARLASGAQPASVSAPASAGAKPFAAPVDAAPCQPGAAELAKAPSVVPQSVAKRGLDEAATRVQEACDLFKHLDRLFPSVRQLGWAHPATERALRTAYDAFVAALERRPDLLELQLRPYSLLACSHTIWEPDPPFDVVTYHLFAAGVRSLQIERGLTLDELRGLLTVMLLDPDSDLPPEDDIVSALWDLGLQHVHYETTDPFADGDARQREEFLGETDALEQAAASASASHADRLEARAMAVSIDRNALHDQASPMCVDDAVRVAFSQQLTVGREAWSARYVEALVDGLMDGVANSDSHIVIDSLRCSAADLIVAGRVDVALQLHRTILAQLGARGWPKGAFDLTSSLTDAMFGGETLTILLERLKGDPSAVHAFEGVLDRLSGSEFRTVLSALRASLPERMRVALLRYVARCAPGREVELGRAIPGSDPLILFPLIDILRRLDTPASRKAIEDLVRSKDIAVRIEVRIITASDPDAVQDELSKLVNDRSLGVRVACLRAISRHNVKRLIPSIVRRIQAPSFTTLDTDERREHFMALVQMAPERGEALALEVARKGGMFTSDSREQSRIAAIEALGAASRSRAVAEVLRQIASARWAISDDTRNRAVSAALQIEARVASALSEGVNG
ncbi:MAG: serine/threonine protein kinase [Polyangiaceae bacterium]|nr:serine/threonine protein kinase [Polyangiaceae bacterium]